MGRLIDLRLVFEEKRILDASAHIEFCSKGLLLKALDHLPRSPQDDEAPVGRVITLRDYISRRASWVAHANDL